ncbi:MAG: phosphoribosylformylglycinamidine cyclo-ligase [Candidatus Thermoplasmatota archaeon]|nr:phosphoribosylformylglycinamidine cyclo-ligase [Candidatus Thermoplasmatota archaeon]MCL5731469.1 phosphoribosylformylglycinamidine cyclo-ligase [Candidatus Thermoplasmatota archaeon]
MPRNSQDTKVRQNQGEFISNLIRQLKYKRDDFHTIGSFGGFTSLIDLGNLAVALNTDNVGTKSIIAEEMKKFDTLGIDCIAMNVNDTITVGAEPIAMVDYIELNRIDPEIARQLGSGLNVGAQMANITIVGGETSVVPDLVSHLDMAGTVFGIVQKNQIITGEKIADGDLIFSLGSSGVHSNGFTTIRRIMKENEIKIHDRFPGEDKTWGEVLLEPTRIYVREIMDILNIVEIKGMANITGGGLRNISRLKEMDYVIENPPDPQGIFKEIMKLGNLNYEEMYEIFNMGIGFVVIIDPESKRDMLSTLRNKVSVREIGVVHTGSAIKIPKFEVEYHGYF